MGDTVQLQRGEPAGRRDEPGRFLDAHPDTARIDMMLCDINGVLRGKWLPPSGLAGLYGDGVALALSALSLDVWGRDVPGSGVDISIGDPDGLCRPVPGTLTPVPWAETPSGQVLVSMTDRDGKPFFSDPRVRLEAVVDRLRARGLEPVTAVELEFYLVDAERADLARPHAVLSDPDDDVVVKSTYAIADLRAYEAVLGEIAAACAAQGIPAETVVSEAAPGQFEINLIHQADALTAADHAVLLKHAVKGVAERHGLVATFMAKPFPGLSGNGMHVHMSATDTGGANVFADGEDDDSALKRHAVAGMLATMPDALALFAPSLNSFRRLEPGAYAPVTRSWGRDNRSVAVRIPNATAAASRIEHRAAGADANPYLVMAAILAGADFGIEHRLVPPEPASGDAHAETDSTLPVDQRAAIEAFERSDFIEEYFGAPYRHLYATVKRAEMATVNRVVTALEYRTYLRDA